MHLTRNLRPRRSQKALWRMPLGLHSKTITRNIQIFTEMIEMTQINSALTTFACTLAKLQRDQTLVKPLATRFSTRTS